MMLKFSVSPKWRLHHCAHLELGGGLAMKCCREARVWSVWSQMLSLSGEDLDTSGDQC